MDSEIPPEEPFDVLWFIATVAAVVGGWFSFAVLALYVDFDDVHPGLQWFCAVPHVLGTLAVLATIGMTLVPPDTTTSFLYSESYVAQRRMFMMLALLAVLVLTGSQYLSAMVIGGKLWWKHQQYRATAGLLASQVPFTMALFLRWRQLVSEYKEWALCRRRAEGITDNSDL